MDILIYYTFGDFRWLSALQIESELLEYMNSKTAALSARKILSESVKPL
jgi:hypothetical protein